MDKETCVNALQTLSNTHITFKDKKVTDPQLLCIH